MRRRMAVVVGLGVLVAPDHAIADDAEPTQYRSEVVSVVPAVAGLVVDVVGGDSFLSLYNGAGGTVTVLGYEGEPYLRFSTDGVVTENIGSPTTALNADRYGSESGSDASVAGERWQVVATDGRWAWHDHRVHWMSPTPPLGLGPGDEVVDDVVPLVVDGIRVEVRVVSTWEPRPSLLPAVCGAAVALGAALLAARRGRRARVALVGGAASAALVAGAWHYWSLPVAARPTPFVVAAPLAAVMAAAVGWVYQRRRGSTERLAAIGCIAIGSMQLAAWSWRQVDGLIEPVLPTTMPFPVDRAITACVGVVALASLMCVGQEVFAARHVSFPRRPTATAADQPWHVPRATGWCRWGSRAPRPPRRTTGPRAE